MSYKPYILAASVLLGLAGFAQQPAPATTNQQPNPGAAQGPAGHAMPTVDDQLKHMTDRLGLSTEQQTKIKPILEDSHLQAQTVMNDSSLTPEDRRAKMRSLHESSSAKIRDVLNDDQKKKYDEWQQEMRDRMRQRQSGENPPPK